MYISGSLGTFNQRIHQLPTGRADLNKFELEAQVYIGQLVSNKDLYKTQRVFQQIANSITKTGLAPQRFFTGIRYF